ncbi:MAG: acyl-CoA dehydrogenase, partial [Halioglobus sp.]|nr:acyl-CoA dehydrogenase [Halioglobus sp.]
QFGRPIGSFQALKHRLAEHAANLEGAKAAAAHAARAVQVGAPDAAVAVSVAKSHCGRHATEIIRDCVQMHGGIGVTDDLEIGFFLKRARVAMQILGDTGFHKNRYATLNGY